MTSPGIVLFPPRQQIYLSDAVIAVGGMACLIFAGGTPPAVGVALMMIGVVLLAGAGISALYVASGRISLVLDSAGLTLRRGGRKRVLPVEAIRELGVVREGRITRLALWYDPKTDLDPVFLRYARPGSGPGMLRLTPIGPAFSTERVIETRRLVESAGIARWRD